MRDSKAAASFFRDFYKPFARGAFTVPRSNDIELADAKGEVFEVPGAIAIGGVLRRPKKVTVFNGDEFWIPSGHLFVSDFAANTAGAGLQLIDAVRARHRERACWLDIFEESILQRAVASRFEHVASRITAAAEVRGLYSSSPLLQPYVLPSADVPTLKVVAESFITEEEQRLMLAELQLLAPWADHYSSYNRRGSWSAFALRGYKADDPSFIIKPAEMDAAWKEANKEALTWDVADTPLMAMFKRTRAIVNMIPGAKQRVRFMRLKSAGGELSRHADITDREAGTRNSRVMRLHLPLQTDPGVRFAAWTHRGERIELHMAERNLHYLDTRKPHTARNDGARDRIHLVVDAYGCDELRKWLVA